MGGRKGSLYQGESVGEEKAGCPESACPGLWVVNPLFFPEEKEPSPGPGPSSELAPPQLLPAVK